MINTESYIFFCVFHFLIIPWIPRIYADDTKTYQIVHTQGTHC